MARQRAFLLDLDGVLVDSRPLVRAGWLRLAASRGVRLTERDLEARLYGRRTVDILVDVFGLTPAQARVMVAAGIDDRSAELAAGAPLPAVPGARAFVAAAAARGIPYALVTSTRHANLALALARLDMRDAFAVVVDATATGRGKPFPDPYLAGAARLGVAPGDAVVFEDSPAGLAAGLAAGARCVALTTTVPRALLGAADLVVRDFTGLDPEQVLALLPPRLTPQTAQA